MRIVQVSEAASTLPRLLEEVGRGETLILAQEGRAVARIVRETPRNQVEIERAVEEIKKLRKRAGKASVEDLLQWRDEGRRLQ